MMPLIVMLMTLTLLFGGLRWGHAEIIGDWVVDTTSDSLVYAAATNDSGGIIGQYCEPAQGSCIWVLAMKTACERDHKYAVLANSDAGAAHLQVLCTGELQEGYYRYAFTSFDEVDNMIRKASRVGLAFPLKTDEFVVVRFNVRGAERALSMMRSSAELKRSQPATRGTRDKRL